MSAELDQAAEEIKDLSSDVKDILIHTLFPNISRKFLDIKFGHIQVESEDSDNTEKKTDANDSVAVEPNKNNLNSDEIPTRSDQIRSFNVFVEDQYFKVDVDPIIKNFKSIEKFEQPNSGKPKNKTVKSNGAKENTLIAPMAGTFLRYEVEVGQEIKSGDSVLVIESMKMENSIPALADSVVAELPFKPGDAISKGDILIKWE